MTMVRVAAISYLNTLPFVYGLKHSSVINQIEMVSCTPSQAASKLINNEIDLGIIPTAVIPENDSLYTITDYCIGAENSVLSVLVCSPLPLNEIKVLYADVDSKTSLLLLKVLLENYWKMQMEIVPFDYSNTSIEYSKSYLLIGDKAMEYSDKFEFCYDLAFEWNSFSKMPFVFACWTANKELDPVFVSEFNEALKYGVNNIAGGVRSMNHKFSNKFAFDYLTNNISYIFNKNKKDGLSMFWKMAFDPSKFRVRW